MIRRLRLITGVTLFVYLTTHFLNHALGLVSYQAMEEGRQWFLALWRNPIGTIVLYGSITTHFSLALWAIYDRRNLRYTIGEGVQLALGISVPLLLALHIVGTRGAFEFAGTDDNYAYVLLAHFLWAPELFYFQIIALFSAWIHGCIGLYYWLRLKSWYGDFSYALFAAALLMPVISALGYIDGGQEVLSLYEDTVWRRAIMVDINPPIREIAAELTAMAAIMRWVVVGGVVAALIARAIRAYLMQRKGVVQITYPNGQTHPILPGLTLLDASRSHGIPHASVCGGRGRCSTCRVRIVAGFTNLPKVSAEEKRVLERIGAPPQVRLACQTRPVRDLSMIPLLPPTANPSDGQAQPSYLRGEEREIVILFADLRDFTSFSEQKLPYDVVFVLNRYFASMGSAVAQSGGHLDKFIGDGVMALFGVDRPVNEAALQALTAAKLMARRLDELNESLSSELSEPLRIGIGLHVGPAIIGEMGYGKTISLTAVGDSVNTASRLEALTKDYSAQLVLSEAVAQNANIDLSAFPSHDIGVRGRSEQILARVILRASDLPL
ncbi:adenylate/guanylate cyclase domain-containing protein [Alphaproteobacteria bacterium]|nr:adenylate/guanylate cyclase domain-containing protein [Alphaproteobacteria bacterium]